MSEARYRVTVNGLPDMAEKPLYAEGETVRILMSAATDVSVRVTCEQADVRFAGTENGFLVYEFRMPAGDADVRTRVKDTMNPEPKGFFARLFGARRGKRR